MMDGMKFRERATNLEEANSVHYMLFQKTMEVAPKFDELDDERGSMSLSVDMRR